MLRIGRSTRSLEELIELLKAHEAACVVDVRAILRSRTNPHGLLPDCKDATMVVTPESVPGYRE